MTRRWFVFALVFVGIVVSYIDRGNLSIAAPSVMREFGIGPPAMGVLLSAFFWTYGAFQLPAGAIVDRFGIRRTYAGAFLIWSIASASIGLTRGTGEIVALRMVLGLAESIGPLASLTFIRNSFPGKDQGLPTSLYIAGQSIGPALGALAGSLLLNRFGWRALFAATGLGALIWLPFWLLAAPRGPVRPEAAAAPPAPPAAPWRAFAANRPFRALSICILLSSYYWYFVLTWVPGYLVLSRGFTTLEMGRIVSTCLFAMAASNVATGYAADRLAARRGVFRARLLFTAAGYAGTSAILLLLVLPGRAWVLPVLAVSLCATGTGNAGFWAIAQQIAPRHIAGRTIGFLNTLSQLAGAAAPVITGWIAGPQNRFAPAILAAGICPVFAALSLLAAGHGGLERAKALFAGEMPGSA